MFVFLGHSRDLMRNWIGFMNFLDLFYQYKMWNRSFLDPWSQIGTWPFRVHPWRLRILNPWWQDRDFRENNFWTWRGHVDLVLKTCRARPLIIFYDIGLYWGKRFGHIWTHFLRYTGEFFTVCCCGGSSLLCKLSAISENIWESWSIATIWESPMLENGAWGDGLFKAWANSCAAMITFSEEEL